MCAKRVDANQSSIVRELRQVGMFVVDLHAVGKGVPDILVCHHNRRTGTTDNLLVEIKTAKGTLTDAELEFHDDYPEGGPLIIARDSGDVLRWFGLIY